MLLVAIQGCIHLLNTRKYCDNARKYCGNAHEYWPNTWKMCSPSSAIFVSIVTILISFEAILMLSARAFSEERLLICVLLFVCLFVCCIQPFCKVGLLAV